MRVGVAIAVACLTLTTLAAADPAAAAVRKPTNIPPQGLGSALQSLATDRNFQVLYRTETVGERRTAGAIGELTLDEALTRLLDGTGLAFQYLDDKTVTILAVASGTPVAAPGNASSRTERPDAAADKSKAPAPVAPPREEQPRAARFWGRARLAQVDQQSASSTLATQESEVVEELVVTGTRIKRATSYDQPTPVTSLNADALQSAAPGTISDALNQLPQFSYSGGRTASCCSAGFAPGAFLNLRGLANGGQGTRTLVLLDGERVAPTRELGDVDTNLLPELLTQRVDVVTGGASAVYGSDAVAGVVNYVIDQQFTGVKFLAQTGQTNYADDKSIKVGVAAGQEFAGGRGHALLSLEHYDANGIPSLADRPSAEGAGLLNILGGSGTAAVPYQELANTRRTLSTDGGVIVNSAGAPVATTADPLAGLVFDGPSATHRFITGTVPPGTGGIQIGGDGSIVNSAAIAASLKTNKLFTRLSYELTDAVRAHLRLNASKSSNVQHMFHNRQESATAFTIFRDNAFLPTDIAAAMSAANGGAGLASFRLGRFSRDLGWGTNDYDNTNYDVSLGFEGKINETWNWHANYAHGQTKETARVTNNAILDNLYAAADAVVNPANGQTVCRVTLTNPGAFPGCVPINLFGNGTPSQAAIDFVTGTSRQDITNKQDIVSAYTQGSVVELPAGPLTAAVGGEYRKRSLLEESNDVALGQINNTGIRGLPTSLCPSNAPCRFGRFNLANFGEADGSDDVKEAYIETALPLLKDAFLAKSLELDGAFRYTDYENSGGVNTWKFGVGYAPLMGLRLRAARSRDIRAPNLFELFSGPVVSFGGSGQIRDPQFGGAPNAAPITITTRGNSDLQPEKADTWTVGMVFQPEWLPGFVGSVDYYKIDIEQAISSALSSIAALQGVVNNCQGGDAASCSQITRDPTSGEITNILLQAVNLNARNTKGIDFDLSYSHNLGPGKFGIRTVVNRLFDYIDTVGGVSTQYAGKVEVSGARPKWRGNLSLTYDLARASLFVQERYIGQLDQFFAGNRNGVFANPTLGSVLYTDVTATWRFDEQGKYEIYGTANNVFNRKAPFYPPSVTGLGYPTVFQLYDVSGSYFTLGARARF
jgi:outer membrane receptor protein involved in Fe transport